MCAPPDSTWSDPMLWKAIFTSMGVVGIYLGGRLVRELGVLNTAAAAVANKRTAGEAMYRIAEETQDTRLRLLSMLANQTRALERIGSKIEDRTAIERRKQVS